ncbi:hypothetical protein CSUI_007326, partial [Cystoisospora suis]
KETTPFPFHFKRCLKTFPHATLLQSSLNSNSKRNKPHAKGGQNRHRGAGCIVCHRRSEKTGKFSLFLYGTKYDSDGVLRNDLFAWHALRKVSWLGAAAFVHAPNPLHASNSHGQRAVASSSSKKLPRHSQHLPTAMAITTPTARHERHTTLVGGDTQMSGASRTRWEIF